MKINKLNNDKLITDIKILHFIVVKKYKIKHKNMLQVKVQI